MTQSSQVDVVHDATGRDELRLSCLMAAVYAIVGVHLPFFPVWLNSRGLDASAIAVIMAAAPGIRIFSTLTGSRRGDRAGNHADLLIAHGAAAGVAYALMGTMQGFAPILATVALLAFAQGPIGILADGIILGEARRRRENGLTPLHYSWVRGWGSVAVLVLMLLSGPIARVLPNDDIIWLLAAVAAASALASHLSLRTALARGVPSKAPVKKPPASPIARPWLIALVIVSAALIQSSHAFVLAFGSLHWKALGHDENFVSLAWATALAFEVAFFLAASRWFGGEKNATMFLIAGGVIALLRWLWMSTRLDGANIFIAQALHSVSCAAVQLGPAYLLAELAGRERVAQSQAWLAATNALFLCLASFWSGPLLKAYGQGGYLGMAAMSATGLALALVVGAVWRRRGYAAHPVEAAG